MDFIQLNNTILRVNSIEYVTESISETHQGVTTHSFYVGLCGHETPFKSGEFHNIGDCIDRRYNFLKAIGAID